MAALSAIWSFLKGLPWKRIAVVVGVLAVAVLLYKAPWAYDRGVHSRDAEVARLQTDNTTLKGNVTALQAKIDLQNSAILKAQAEGDARVKAGQEALADVRKANEGKTATIAALRKEGSKPHAAGEPCTAPPLVAGITL